MIICVTPEDVSKRRVITGGNGAWAREIVGDRSTPWDGPCGHIVRQELGQIVEPHFHEMDQYQVFVAGSGHLGGHPVSTGAVHYSDAYSGYGPIVPGDGGCSYVTLRPSFDTSHHPLPEEAALARGRRGRQHMSQLSLDAAESGGVRTIFERGDGVAVHQQRALAGQPLEHVAAAGGRYWIVMQGGVVIDGRDCPEGSCLWVGEGEPAPSMVAGADGALVGVFCFAQQASRDARMAGAGNTAEP